VVLSACAVAVALAPLLAGVPVVLVLAGLAVLALVGGTCLHPPLGAYLLLALTPLTAGFARGEAIPVLRPHEAVLVLVIAGLAARGLWELSKVRLARPRFNPVDAAIILMAVTGSVLPLLWLVARGQAVTSDDLLYASTLWKYYVLYLVVRKCVRTEQEVRRCLWVVLAVGVVVTLIAILQSLDLLGVAAFLRNNYEIEPGQIERGVGSRGSSTLASSIAVADVMVFSLAIAAGWLVRQGRHKLILIAVAAVLLLGVAAAGQYSGVIALVVALMAVGWITGRSRQVGLAVLPATPLAALLMWPVIARRLAGFDSSQGWPPSWLGRLTNLKTFFWPKLAAGDNFVLGVRPSARIPAVESWRSYIWIESGHTWLLWTGGIPLFLAFFVFLFISLQATSRVARARTDAVGVAAIASFTSLVVMAVMMMLDVHLTLRGEADLFFALLAMACGPARAAGSGLKELGNGRHNGQRARAVRLDSRWKDWEYTPPLALESPGREWAADGEDSDRGVSGHGGQPSTPGSVAADDQDAVRERREG